MTVVFYSLSLIALPLIVLVSVDDDDDDDAAVVPQYWPVSCVVALSSVTLFIGTSCYVKLALMFAATVAYSVVYYVISGHVSDNDSRASTQ